MFHKVKQGKTRDSSHTSHPWKSISAIFHRLVSEPLLFFVGVYHLPKGIAHFLMVVDFQG